MQLDEQWSGFNHEAKAIAQPLRNAVIVDLVRRKHVSRDACMSLLRLHIQHNVWQVSPVCLASAISG